MGAGYSECVLFLDALLSLYINEFMNTTTTRRLILFCIKVVLENVHNIYVVFCF